MALPDLLWACPACGEDRGLEPDGSMYTCHACATRFYRGDGASIVAEDPDGSRTSRPPYEWVDRLPSPQTLVAQADTDDNVIRTARVSARRVADTDIVHDRDGYLNRIEIWGDAAPGTLQVRRNRLIYAPEAGEAEEWPLETLTAVQASSSSLQLNLEEAPALSFRFHDDSIFLWERLLHATLRDFYRRTGRGEIVEFQPRITHR